MGNTIGRALFATCLIGPALACGKVEEGEDVDARVIDAQEIDTPPEIDAVPARCNPTAAFGTPMHIAELNGNAQDECARLSLDERTVYFSSTRGGGAGGWDIWFATRASRDVAWGQPMLLGGNINTLGMERCPAVTDDQLAIYADNYGTNYNLAVSTRQNTSETFGSFTLVNELNVSTMGAMHDADPYMGPNHTIYWSSDAQGNFDLHRATWNGSSFRMAERVAGTNLATAETEAGAVVSRDELTLFFQSARTGSMNASYDIWMATRANTAAAFGEPVNVTALNSNGAEYPNWISEDGCIIYFTRDVGVGATDYNLMMAIRGM